VFRVLKQFILLTVFVIGSIAKADAPFVGQIFSYYGKLPSTYEDKNLVSLEISFYQSETGDDVVSRVPRLFKNLPLISGEFNVIIEMDQLEYDAVFQNPPRHAFIQIKDTDKNVGFRRMPFLPSLPEQVTNSRPSEKVTTQDDFLSIARSACVGIQTAGAKFVVTSSNPVISCETVCVNSESKSKCLRGWTTFTDGSYFEFGDECNKNAVPFQNPFRSRVCCCLTTAKPMPLSK
jgi:hypothetical protein